MMDVIRSDTTYKDVMKPGSFVGAVLIAAGIKNSLIIFHGVSGCNIEATHFRSDLTACGIYIPIIPTGLNEDDCINGGNEKLKSVLTSVLSDLKRKNKLPEVVFVITSDASSIVGDDIVTISKNIEKSIGVKIIPLDTSGFYGGVSSGVDLILEKLLVEFKPDKTIAEENNCINLIAPCIMGSKNWNNDADEIIRLLKSSNINVNIDFARNFSLEALQYFYKARYNYNLSSENLDGFSKYLLNSKNNVFFDELPLPVGVANTEEWLLAIAEKFDSVELAKLILEEDKKFVQKQLKFNYNFSWMSTLMYSKRCGIIGNAKFTASLARCLLWDFGMQPSVIALYAETEAAIEVSLNLLKKIENQCDFKVLINPSYYEYADFLKKNNVDFAIGSIQDKPLCIGNEIPHLSLTGYNFFNQYNFIPFPNTGIRGILGLLTELSGVMQDAFYLKNSIIKNNFQPKNSL